MLEALLAIQAIPAILLIPALQWLFLTKRSRTARPLLAEDGSPEPSLDPRATGSSSTALTCMALLVAVECVWILELFLRCSFVPWKHAVLLSSLLLLSLVVRDAQFRHVDRPLYFCFSMSVLIVYLVIDLSFSLAIISSYIFVAVSVLILPYFALAHVFTMRDPKEVDYLSNFTILFARFLWPKEIRLYFNLVACFCLLILQRVVNLLVPLQFKVIIDTLTPGGSHSPVFSPYSIGLYVIFRFLQGSSGLLGNLQSFLWIPVGQSIVKGISVSMLHHLHSLSLNFHLNRKTGEVLRIMDRGTASVGSLLNYLIFSITPIFLDLGVAVLAFLVLFDWVFVVIVVVSIGIYIMATISITEWRTKFRREMIELDNASSARAVDSLLNFETVKYFNAEKWEVKRYEEAICDYQKADFKSQASLSVLNVSQNVVIVCGLLAGSMLLAYRVAVTKSSTVGDFVLFLTYLAQLYQPLNWFGTYFRMITQQMIDLEKTMSLLNENNAICDAEDAVEFSPKGGRVVFENVYFSYDVRETALKNVSFEVEPGQTVALVGPSGGGKSTVFRLLFRFYDVDQGRILVDGQDIRSVTQDSLRSEIGVVPQDCVLFNDTVLYNLSYAKPDAPLEEVVEKAKLAQIHDKIEEFPDKYDTKVGERGMRLSGGEKQRIAIARTMLKNPSLILLDEATSALDNTTERQIQKSLVALSKNRTTLVIAHRLSTIIHADKILVLDDGSIAESGTHQELVAKKGKYHELWSKEQETNQAANE